MGPAAAADSEILRIGREFEAVHTRYLEMCELTHKQLRAFFTALHAATGIWHRESPNYGEPGYDEYRAVYERVHKDHEHPDQDFDGIHAQLWSLVDRLLEHKATTLAELGVVARVLTFTEQPLVGARCSLWPPEDHAAEEESRDVRDLRLLRQFVEDVLRLAGQPEPMQPAAAA
jgi:hypothetical protein